jgi:hypothetical protein
MRIEMPSEKNKFMEFKSLHKKLPVPFVIYADFEALTRKVEGPALDPSQSNTQTTQIHEPC